MISCSHWGMFPYGYIPDYRWNEDTFHWEYMWPRVRLDATRS